MKKGWQTKNLGDLCDVVGGGTPPKDKPAFYSGDIPWATVRDMRQDVITETEFRITKDAVKSSATNIIPSGNVVIATRVGLGKVCLLGQDTAINQDLRGIVPRSDKALVVRYLYWWLKSIADVIVAEGTGATVQGVKLPFVKSLPIPVPPLAEQQRIVGLLDEAFEGLATAKANAEKNLQNARALFESHLQSVFTQRGLGWRHDQLDALTEPDTPITYGVVKPGDEGEITFVRGGDLVRGKVRLTQLRTITRAVSDQYRRTLLRGGELLICLVGQPGQVAVAPIELAGTNIARQVGLIRLKKMIDAEFVRYFLQSAPGAEALGARESGSVQQVINLGELRQVSVPYPDFVQQRKIVAGLEAMETETQRLARLYERKLAALEALKKSLLHQAFTGAL